MKWEDLGDVLIKEAKKRNWRPNPFEIDVADGVGIKGVTLFYKDCTYGRGAPTDTPTGVVGVLISRSEWLREPDDAARLRLVHDKFKTLAEELNYLRTTAHKEGATL